MKVGGREYSCRCGMCNRVAEGYAPKGFRTVDIGARSASNVQMHTDSVFCCSDICEAQWLMQATTKRIEELLGEEYGKK